MNESTKSKLHFRESDLAVLKGRVLDIGAGRDLVVPTATPFDLEHGDANNITAFPPESFDCVYSSHCLEHMHHPVQSLQNWWSLVKPGGHLFLIVPDEDLYEQGAFPSHFNPDHKHTFTIGKKVSWSPNSHNVYELCRSLSDAEVESIVLNDIGYDRNISFHGSKSKGKTLRRLAKLYRSLRKRKAIWRSPAFERWIAKWAGWDQTGGAALAQIEAIVHKRELVGAATAK